MLNAVKPLFGYIIHMIVDTCQKTNTTTLLKNANMLEKC